MAVNTAPRATISAAGLTYVRGFASAGTYDNVVTGAERGEVEYEITRSAWRNNADDSPGRRRYRRGQPAGL
jgi:hypothetical protein